MREFYQQTFHTSQLSDVPKGRCSPFSYTKTFKTHKEQIQLLKSRNLKIENEEKAIDFLRAINYYRISIYFLPFQYPKDSENFDFCI